MSSLGSERSEENRGSTVIVLESRFLLAAAREWQGKVYGAQTYQFLKEYYQTWLQVQAQILISTLRPTIAVLVFLFLFGYVQQCWLSSVPPKSCPVTGSVSVLVLAQQLPKQTINLGVRSLEITEHAVQRMAQRGVSIAEIRAAVLQAQLFAYSDNNRVKIGYYDARVGLFLAVDQRHHKLITVIRKVNSGYPERLMTRG